MLSLDLRWEREREGKKDEREGEMEGGRKVEKEERCGSISVLQVAGTLSMCIVKEIIGEA